ncbi:MAG TPA: S53 family peptidase [Pseudonocardia sp.]|nr:S53 family peptidase [Pseudonocardia sp.]
MALSSRRRWSSALLLTTAAVLLAACGTSAPGGSGGSAPPPPHTDLPVPRADAITFYLSLPGPPGNSLTGALADAAFAASTPGNPQYRHFSSLADVAARFGASEAQIDAADKAIRAAGLEFAADPTRLFARVSGTPERWAAALKAPLQEQAATTDSPFTAYGLPQAVPATLTPEGTGFLLPVTLVHDPKVEGPRRARATGEEFALSGQSARTPWPVNEGTPLQASCSTPILTNRQVYTPQQVHTAYGIPAGSTASPTVTILDLGGGWLADDLKLAGECFGFTPPKVEQAQGDGVAAAIANADGETSLDLQTVSAVAPAAKLRLVQGTGGGGALLDAYSRAIGDKAGPPDVTTLSYGGCAIAEAQSSPQFLETINNVLAMSVLVGTSSFVAAGDSGSTTCERGSGVAGPSLSFPAVSAFVTAVGGTRLAIGAGNGRTGETVWNDTPYGQKAAGGGGVSKLVPRPPYQGQASGTMRSIPDVSALADITPGWPVVTDGSLHTVGGTSGSSPLTAAATALVAGTEKAAGRPPLGLVNGWFYTAAAQPGAFFDVVQGENDLDKVGCCTAAPGYDTASGIGVPNWAVLPTTLPAPA